MPSAMIALAISFLASVSASPLEVRSTCRPNFGGPPGLSIINLNREWSLASSPPIAGTTIVPRAFNINNNEFRVEFTGQPENTYLIKPVGFPELRVAASAFGHLHIATPDSTDPTQSWNIACNQCGDPTSGTFTTGCTITSAANNQCVQMGPSALLLKNCNPANPHQSFNFGATNN